MNELGELDKAIVAFASHVYAVAQTHSGWLASEEGKLRQAVDVYTTTRLSAALDAAIGQDEDPETYFSDDREWDVPEPEEARIRNGLRAEQRLTAKQLLAGKGGDDDAKRD
jgi:hypothetical protein